VTYVRKSKARPWSTRRQRGPSAVFGGGESARAHQIRDKVEGRGRPRQRIPDTLSVAAEDVLATAKWQNISWRTGTKGKLRARFAAVRRFLAWILIRDKKVTAEFDLLDVTRLKDARISSPDVSP
jgi:hypothetical protein